MAKIVYVTYRNDDGENISIHGPVDDEGISVIIQLVQDEMDIQDIIDELL